MDHKEILRHVDHTLLTQTATWDEIRKICDDAVEYGTASVCIPPCYVKEAAEYLKGRIPVCTVVGFPNGNMTTAAKEFETKDALANGAEEIDMVINIGWLKDGRYELVENEIRTLKAACGKKILKVIIETCLLTDEEKIKMCELVTKAGGIIAGKMSILAEGAAQKRDDIIYLKEHYVFTPNSDGTFTPIETEEKKRRREAGLL